MTVLLVDAGNSRLKWATLKNATRSPQQALAYGSQQSPQTGALHHLQTLLTQKADIQQVVLVHVLGPAFSEALEQLQEQLAVPMTLIQSQAGYAGIQVAYPNPAHFGTDRFVGLLAARRLFPEQAALIIDSGTAVTIDAIEANGQHRGGVILPGLQLLSDALIKRTQAAHMSATPFDQAKVFNDNTLQAMGSGCLLGLAGSIEGICTRMQEQLATPANILLCGGDTQLITQQLRLAHQAYPDALMEGLQYVAEQEACRLSW